MSEARTPDDLMESAWAMRRASFDLPDEERRAAVAEVRHRLRSAAEALSHSDRRVAYAHALHLLAHVESDEGELARAEELWRAAVTVLRKVDAPLDLAHKLRHLGDVNTERGRLDEAGSHYAEALALHREGGALGDLNYANLVRRLAVLSERLGDLVGAAERWREARTLYADLGIEAGASEADARIAALGQE